MIHRLARRRAPLSAQRPQADHVQTCGAKARQLLGKIPFLASCLAICQSFLFLVGVTRVAFPFLAVNQRGIGLETVGTDGVDLAS